MTLQPPPETDGAAGLQGLRQGRLRRALRNAVLLIVVSCCTALVFVIALAATMPASALRRVIDLPTQITDLRGTIWRGHATLTNGYALDWNGHLAALILAKIAADVTLTGADTQLTGTFTLGPRTMALRDLTGRAGPGLLALAPGLPIDSCTSRAIIDVTRASFGPGRAAAEGQIAVDAGECLDFAGNTFAIPALTLTLHSVGNDAVADLSDTQSALAQLTIAGDRRLIIRVEPAGAALIPGMPTAGVTMLEYPF